jgi:hypothetical protein
MLVDFFTHKGMEPIVGKRRIFEVSTVDVISVTSSWRAFD